MRKDRLIDQLPTLFKDMNKRMESWGKEGKIDPFVDIYNMVFHMTTRLGSCRAISEDAATVDKMANMFLKTQKSRTATSLLLPWFPSPGKIAAKLITYKLYTMLCGHIEARKTQTPTTDAIDVLLSEGYETNDVIETLFTILHAGVLNTGIISCWILIELALNPEWQAKVRKEALDLVDNHAVPHTNGIPFHERLATISLSAWEDELPILDVCLRETLRLYMLVSALRRNLHDDVHIGDKKIEKGTFVVYSAADVHLDSNIYSNPEKFDPDRFRVRAEDVNSKATHPFLGWGAGRHPCSGMRVAKFEIRLLVILFILTFEYKLVDDKGRLPNPLPRANKNDLHQARPVGKPCYLEYKRIN